MISQANWRPGHATWLSAIRSKPFAPVFTFQSYVLKFIIPFPPAGDNKIRLRSEFHSPAAGLYFLLSVFNPAL